MKTSATIGTATAAVALAAKNAGHLDALAGRKPASPTSFPYMLGYKSGSRVRLDRSMGIRLAA